MGGGRAAAAVLPSPALTSPSCFSSNQPVSLRGRQGWECSRPPPRRAAATRRPCGGVGCRDQYYRIRVCVCAAAATEEQRRRAAAAARAPSPARALLQPPLPPPP